MNTIIKFPKCLSREDYSMRTRRFKKEKRQHSQSLVCQYHVGIIYQDEMLG